MSTETWSTKADSHIMEYNMLWTLYNHIYLLTY